MGLNERSKKIRRRILKASYEAKACHIGSALSCVDILIDIFWNRFKWVEGEGWTEMWDTFIFSKASGVAALYSVLAELWMIPEDMVSHYLKNYPLVSKEVPRVVHSFGSLGHGLPVAVGIALADREKDVYVLMSDGEIQEGTTWESILFAAHHNLKNLKIIVDRNGLQACGKTEEILKIDKALKVLNSIFPIEVVKTTKGKGVDFMENDYKWHYLNLTPELYEKAIFQLS